MGCAGAEAAESQKEQMSAEPINSNQSICTKAFGRRKPIRCFCYFKVLFNFLTFP